MAFAVHSLNLFYPEICSMNKKKLTHMLLINDVSLHAWTWRSSVCRVVGLYTHPIVKATEYVLAHKIRNECLQISNRIRENLPRTYTYLFSNSPTQTHRHTFPLSSFLFSRSHPCSHPTLSVVLCRNTHIHISHARTHPTHTHGRFLFAGICSFVQCAHNGRCTVRLLFSLFLVWLSQR